jgi:hypothetical protein
MSRDDHITVFLALARQHGDHIREVDVVCDPKALLHRERLTSDLKAWAVALELPINPALGRADAARRVVLPGEDVARAEAFELPHGRGDALLGYGVDDHFHRRIQPRGGCLGACAANQQNCHK